MTMNDDPIPDYSNLSDKAKQILCAAAKAEGDNEGLIQLGDPPDNSRYRSSELAAPDPKTCLAGGVSMTSGRRESADCERAIGQLVNMKLATRNNEYYYTLTPRGYETADENCK